MKQLKYEAELGNEYESHSHTEPPITQHELEHKYGLQKLNEMVGMRLRDRCLDGVDVEPGKYRINPRRRFGNVVFVGDPDPADPFAPLSVRREFKNLLLLIVLKLLGRLRRRS